MYHNDEFVKTATETFAVPVDRKRLFNVSYNVDTSEVKCYSFGEDLTFLKKYTEEGMTRQYFPRTNAEMLERYKKRATDFLGYSPDFNQVIIDTVAGDVIYFYIEPTLPDEFERFYVTLLSKFNLERDELFRIMSELNNKRVDDFQEAWVIKTTPLVKVPMNGGNLKVYARPFMFGNSFNLDSKSHSFFEELLLCIPLTAGCLKACYASYEFGTQKRLFVSQDEGLKSALLQENIPLSA